MYSYRIAILILILVSVTHRSVAQLEGQKLIDSLEVELSRSKTDTNKVKILAALSINLSDYNPARGMKLGEEALQLSRSLDWKAGMAWAYNSIGCNFMVQARNQQAMEQFKKAYALNKEIGNKRRMAQNLGNMAILHQSEGAYPQSLAALFEALKIFEEIKDQEGIAIQYGNIGNVYDEIKNFPKALYYDSMSMQLYRQLGMKDGEACELGNIGNVYSSLGELDKALHYNTSALTIYEQLGSYEGIARNLISIGVIYCTQKKYREALQVQYRALKLYESVQDLDGLSLSYCNMGEYYFHIVEDQRSFTPDSLIPGSKSECLSRARQYTLKAIGIDSGTMNLDLMAYNYELMSRIEEKAGNLQGALNYHRLYANAKDSAFKKENHAQIEKLTTEREIALKDKQIRINELEVAKKRNERGFFIAGIVALLLIVFIILRNYRNQLQLNQLLAVEKKKSDDLLLNILPSEVADELKDKGHAEARLFHDVTVMFTDFVNFTGVGEKLAPQALVSELHTCFMNFDRIIEKHGLEKIKTIGDAYLAVGGLPLRDVAHAENVLKASLEIRQYMEERQAALQEKTFRIRIGIHTGSVVAGIVGVKKFAYDIWGDTVNTAARMEQNSEAGRINVSETTYEITKEQFHFSFRGDLDVKNKGKMKMYFLETS